MINDNDSLLKIVNQKNITGIRQEKKKMFFFEEQYILIGVYNWLLMINSDIVFIYGSKEHSNQSDKVIYKLMFN